MRVLKKPAFTIILVLVLILGGAYYWLGGFNRLRIETVDVDNYYLLGRHFSGRYDSDTLRNYVDEMRRYLRQGTFEGKLAIIYDQEPQGRQGIVRSFIGLMLKERPADHSPDLEYRQILASQAIRVSKDAHASVMPNPEKIDRLILKYCERERLAPGKQNIEIYLPQDRLRIERPLQPTNP